MVRNNHGPLDTYLFYDVAANNTYLLKVVMQMYNLLLRRKCVLKRVVTTTFLDAGEFSESNSGKTLCLIYLSEVQKVSLFDIIHSRI